MVLPKMTVAQKREFLVEMCNCREYLKTDVELNKAVLKKHLKFLPQQKLYKFRACIEREFRMLEENCIWMSLASSFPDPFDHTINIDLVKNRREVKEWLGKNGSSLCFEVVKRLFEEKGLTGFRVRQNQKGDFIDIYLYDSLSSGAGYAVSIEASIQQLLIKTRELLSSCTCDSACHKCLKHYRNQYVHGLLDRSAALDLLTWAEKGVRSPMLPVYEQRNLLQSVEQILQFSGVHIDFNHEPIEAKSFHGRKRIVVYPAMWARPAEKNTVFVSDSYLKYAKPYALKTIVDGL